ncbi:hypothetical protein AB1287_17425 [Enterobacter asburiae]|uniref:hypothetical protein n=1 Tax=Scandinavium sp. UTDF21-P1B TaxID=3446379 RepID=UPI0034751CA4
MSLKNQWKYIKEDNSSAQRVHNAWGQGGAVDYQSGYFHDLIGIDAVWYGAVRPGACDWFNSRSVLHNSEDHAGGFSQFGQRNIRLKYPLVGS